MIDWTSAALVFPGQGSQAVGMGKDIAEQHSAARETFAEADDVLGYALSKLMFEGPEAELNDTYYTQPALYVCSLAILRAMQAAHGDIAPMCMAGHSLGELTALAAAGAYSFADGLRLVQTRGRLMKEAGERHPGAMAALVGLDNLAVAELCARAVEDVGGVLVSANDNSPGQVVVSGTPEAVDRAVELSKGAGAKLARKLAVSIASHSPLMQEAGAAFRQALAEVTFAQPRVPVYGNVNAAPLTTPEAIQEELAAQLTSPVRWTETVQAMAAAGVRTVVEVGPKDVLTGLAKRIDSQLARVNVNSAETFAALS